MNTAINDRKTKELKIAAKIVFLGFCCAVLFCITLRILLYLHGREVLYPYNTFLDIPQYRFDDFSSTYKPTQSGDPYGQGGIYFPFAFLMFRIFTLFSPGIAVALYGLTFSAMLFFIIEYYTKDTKKYFKPPITYDLTIGTFLLSYPVLFCLDRGNIEIILLIFTSIFLILFQKKNYYLSAIILSIPISMKGLPAIFLVLLLKEKKYKAALLCILSTIALTFIALMTFKGGITESWASYHQHASAFANHWLILPGAYHSTSLFLGVKTIAWYLLPSAQQNYIGFTHHVNMLINIYNGIAVITLGAITTYVIKYEASFWKNTALLTFAMIILPGISYDYKLLNILPVLFIFLNRTTYATQLDKIYLTLIALLLIPKNYYYFTLPGHAPINNFINMICIFTITGLILYERFKKKHI
jgi:hypothetical protein